MGDSMLPRAQISVHADDLAKSSIAAADGKVEFMFNPESVRITKTVTPKEGKQAGQNAPPPQFTYGDAMKLEFGEVLFDTFESRANVYEKHVQQLERLILTDDKLHRPPLVVFSWGNVFGSDKAQIKTGLWLITGLDVNYTMFLPNGTPVRCTCKLTLSELPKPTSPKSPDTAHVHLVSRGDTLQGIAAQEYDSPGEWRRIADANGIDDPLTLSPGRRLLIPPILR